MLKQIICGDTDDDAKFLAHLLYIIKRFGWDSLADKNTIKPNLRGAYLYVRKNKDNLNKFNKGNFDNITKDNIVDMINPYLIKYWNVQIIGNTRKASLEKVFIEH